MPDILPQTLLASTARWTAAARAREHARDDRLIDDPWAALLAGEEGAAWIAQRPLDSTLPIVLRTRYFDDFLLHTVQEKAVRQVVLMAAGLDTRAFRLDFPAETHIYELEQAAVLKSKEAALAGAGAKARCVRRAIPADLTAPWDQKLFEAGYNPAQPSLWLLEGFLFYLPSQSVERILDEVSLLAVPGSWLGFDIINTAMLQSPITKAWIEMQAQAGAPWIGTLDNPEEFLAVRGWTASLTQAGQPDANHGRWSLPVLPTRMPDFPHNWFVTAHKG